MPTNSESVSAIDRLIGRIGQLHASPTVAQKLLKLTRHYDFEIAAVASCLEQDPALAARILRVVNSSRYGLSRKVSNIRHAAAYLGQRSLRMFAISFALVETLTTRSRSSLIEGYWPRALTMATVASLLCETQGLDCRDDAYTSALLADVGILILAQLETDRYEPLFAAHEHGRSLLEAEEQEFQFTHPLLGARLLQVWEVPDSIVAAVANHHDSESNGNVLTQMIQSADLFASAINEPVPEKTVFCAVRLQEFGMTPENVHSFLDPLVERIRESEDIMDCGDGLTQRVCEFRDQFPVHADVLEGLGPAE